MVSTHRNRIVRVAAVAVTGLTAAAFAATPAPAGPPHSPVPSQVPEAVSKPKCADVEYSDRTQAADPDGRPNAAGVIFRPRGDVFRIWDNEPDGHVVGVWFNYAGVADKWKPVKSPADGRQRDSVRNVSERYSRICFVVVTHDSQSPIVRYTTRP
jgi:hypothetical protein